MKTKMKTLAAGTILALLIIGGNVQAKGTEVTETGAKIEESTLQLKSWMINDLIWNSRKSAHIVVENDKSLKLENWMTDAPTWNKNSQVQETIEQDSKLEVENWMINPEIWKN